MFPSARPVASGFLIRCLLLLLLGGGYGWGAQLPIPEVEPNDSPALASPLQLAAGSVAAMGSITPTGDVDYFSFSAPPGSRVWITVDTGGGTLGGADSRDSVLTLLAANGSTVLEEDDDDGTGNGCDSTIETGDSSAIAGRVLVDGGTYFIRVAEFAGDGDINPYRLSLVLTSMPPTPEVEPNNSAATANVLVPVTSTIGLRIGNITTALDEDYYSLQVVAGETLHVSVDTDFDRDGGVDLEVALLSPAPSTMLLSADSSADELGAAEAFCFTATVSGNYFVRVRHASSGAGSYQLMVARDGASTLQFSAGSYVVLENGGSVILPVVRGGETNNVATVSVTTSNGTASSASDYQALSQTLTFAAGVVTQFVSVSISNDTMLESNETVFLTLSMPSTGVTLGSPNSAILFILDDDQIPNGSAATASPLDLSQGFTKGATSTNGIPFSISPGGDEDWFSFTAPPGAVLWVFVDAGATQSGEANSRDSILTLFAADGTTILEEDDDDGSGSGCSLVFPDDAGFDSAIAGRLLVTGGTYYLRVRAFSSGEIINPYQIFAALTTFSALSEMESNDGPGFANRLVTGATPIGRRLAEIGTPGDVDYYSVEVPSNSLVYVAIDCDPERDGVGTDLQLDLLSVDGGTVLFSADSSAAEAEASEAFCLALSTPGMYFVRVSHVSPDETGSYNLMATRDAVESEPNGTRATAVALEIFGQLMSASGSVSSGDTDWYSFVAAPGSRAWFGIDTGGSQLPGATSRDSMLTLLASDGLTTLEQDDNDGSGNGLDGTLESGDASILAGTPLIEGGNYYLRANATGVVNPYTLVGIITVGAVPVESEGNNTSALANPIVTAAPAVGLREGNIAPFGDVDYYSVVASSGDILFIALDAAPQRIGTGADLTLDLVSTDGATVLFHADSSSAGLPTDPAAEGFTYRVPAAGTYFVAVRSTMNTGNYILLVARNNTLLQAFLQSVGQDVIISFASEVGRRYMVEQNDDLSNAGSWTPLGTLLQGNGRILSTTDVGVSGQPQRFYRVRQMP